MVRIECGAGSAVLQMDWDDCRDVGGLMLPFKPRQTGSENWTIQCSKAKRDEPLGSSSYRRRDLRQCGCAVVVTVRQGV